MKITKRNGKLEDFNRDKIIDAINKAMEQSGEKDVNGIVDLISLIVEEKVSGLNKEIVSVFEIEKIVFNKLVQYCLTQTAKNYESYRAVQDYKRRTNTTDEDILKFLELDNDEVAKENSNKNPVILSTQRDLIAGEISKDLMKRYKMPTEFVNAHDNGMVHYHDMDFGMQSMINCCLINISDILKNGTVLNGKMYDSPSTFEKACGIMAQCIATVTSNQYGGNSVNVKHLGEYLYKSECRIKEEEKESVLDYGGHITEYVFEKRVEERLNKVCRAGIRSLLWQINGFATHSGQSPFTTLFLEIEDGSEFEKYQAMVVEEIIKQRYKGMKNEKGVYVSPAFPKLIFVLDENNMYPDSKYYNIKKLSIKCSAKRLVPDYISAKKMRELYEGNVFSPMGCRSKLSPWKDENGEYKFEGRFNMGVVSLNLPQIGILANGDMDLFWDILESRLDLVKRMLMFRYGTLKGTLSDVSPLHFQFGALARLKKGETIDSLLENGYATISMGYIGVYEMTKVMLGVSHTDPRGKEFALQVMNKLKLATETWKKETDLGFGLYGSPKNLGL